MSLYGLCPSRDEFYLVVCERCGQVIKPQALKKHVGKLWFKTKILTYPDLCLRIYGLTLLYYNSGIQSILSNDTHFQQYGYKLLHGYDSLRACLGIISRTNTINPFHIHLIHETMSMHVYIHVVIKQI